MEYIQCCGGGGNTFNNVLPVHFLFAVTNFFEQSHGALFPRCFRDQAELAEL